MVGSTTHTIVLAEDQEAYVRAQIECGAFRTVAEVIEAGLHSLRDHDAGRDRWLREEVLPVYVATLADPSRSIPAEQVFRELEEQIASDLHQRR